MLKEACCILCCKAPFRVKAQAISKKKSKDTFSERSTGQNTEIASDNLFALISFEVTLF